MRKIYLFAAALAAIATVSSCTSDDEIVQAPEPTPAPEPAVVKECPFTFNVTVDNGTFKDSKTTRATALTGDALTNAFEGFSMFAIEEMKTSKDATTASSYKTYVGADGVGATFEKKTTTTPIIWGYTGAAWPDPNEADNGLYPGKSYFYAVSFAGEGSGSNSGNLNFNPEGEDVTLKNPESLDGVGFKYTMPIDETTKEFDLSKQEDVLVASNTDGMTSGEVGLTFSHAFANVEVKFIFPGDEENWNVSKYQWEPNNKTIIGAGHFLYVEYIAIHGFKNAGTYNFEDAKNGNGWTPSATNGVIKKVFTGDDRFITPTYFGSSITDTELETYVENDPNLRDAKRECYTPLFTGDNSLMIIPQSVEAWVPDNTLNIGDVINTDDAYIEVFGNPTLYYSAKDGDPTPFNTAQFNAIKGNCLDGENWNPGHDTNVVQDAAGGELYSVYIPFKTSQFKANKKYVLYINLSKLYEVNGNPYFEGAIMN